MGRLLEVKDLSISFGGIKAVQHLNFHIDKGEVLALIGPNGSGKSTTVNMISACISRTAEPLHLTEKRSRPP